MSNEENKINTQEDECMTGGLHNSDEPGILKSIIK